MNDKILKLCLESGLGYHSSVHPDTVKKFAEMIIRECSNAALSVPRYYKDYRSQVGEAVINDCGRAVLEYFGVDE